MTTTIRQFTSSSSIKGSSGLEEGAGPAPSGVWVLTGHWQPWGPGWTQVVCMEDPRLSAGIVGPGVQVYSLYSKVSESGDRTFAPGADGPDLAAFS